MKNINAFFCVLLSFLLVGVPMHAQLQLRPGDAVVTMSGVVWSNNLALGQPNYVMEVFRTRNTSSAPIGSIWQMTPASYNTYSYKHTDWVRDTMGNIFGIAIDNAGNIYTTATGFYGPQVGGISTGQIWKIDAITGGVSAFKDLHSGGQDQRCLGNIKFFNGFLYVSNLEDGKIYAIDVSNPAANFPPFDPGGVGETRRPHGLAIRNIAGAPRLFFSLNGFNAATTEIHSIGISGSSFISTENVEISNFTIKRFPITDMAFSQDNSRLIMSERGTISWTSTTHAHNCEIYEFAFSGTWSNTSPLYTIGTYDIKKNAAGGLSFSKFVIGSDAVIGCDTTIWATSDAIYYPTPSCYGITGFRHSPGNGSVNGVNIDFDNNFTEEGADKTWLGDVEVRDTTLNCQNCQCGIWRNGVPEHIGGTGFPVPIVLTTPLGSGGSSGFLLQCGSNYSFTQGQVAGSLTANYVCAGQCTSNLTWQLNNTTTGALIASGNMNNGPINLGQFNNLACANYRFIFRPRCGTDSCAPCEFFMNVVCDPPPCCPQNSTVTITPQGATYTSSSNPNGWGTYSQSFTLNSPQPVGEIRIDVEHFELNSTDPDCIPCRNNPKTWGSLLGAAYNGAGFTQPIAAFPWSASVFSNGRELIYKPGPLITLNNGTLNVNIAMPNASPVECCVLTANLCLKFTFKDANCRECTYRYCNTNIAIRPTPVGQPNGSPLKNVNKRVDKTTF